MRWGTAIGVLAVAVVIVTTGTARADSRPWLWQCEQIGRLDAQWRCYVRLLLADIDQSKGPAAELPRIDRRARNAGTDAATAPSITSRSTGSWTSSPARTTRPARPASAWGS
jgi:hypothetical protein